MVRRRKKLKTRRSTSWLHDSSSIRKFQCLDNYQNLRSRLEIFISTVPKDLDLKSSVDPVYSSLLF
uniref:Uncharacterized protein n=1 Tax=Glossina palpalis gambiensis TaxID=67801 RepID=A0A1B0B0F8_9MUSC